MMRIVDLSTHPCKVVSVSELVEYYGGKYSGSFIRKLVREGALDCHRPVRPTRKVVIMTASAQRVFRESPPKKPCAPIPPTPPRSRK